MRAYRGSTLLAMPVAIGCNGFVGKATMKAPAAEKAASSMTALDRARGALNHRDSGEAIGNISLSGYSFSRELDIGGGLHVIVMSSNLASGLVVFRGGGAAVATQPTREITWVQLFDLDEDGVSEIVTEEIDARGTGVLEKTFRVYRVMANQVVEIWSGQSFLRHAPDENRIEETSAFLRFDRSGAGRNARLTHLTVDASHQQNEAVYEWRDGTLHHTPQ